MTRIEQWLIDWARLAESVVGILTFTLWRPFWSVHVTIWSLHRRLDRDVEGEYSAW
jgi:hypothetical protein